MSRTLWPLILLLTVVPSASAQGISLGPEQVHVSINEDATSLVVQWAVLAQPYAAADNPVVTWQNGSVPARLVGTIRNGGVSIRTTGYYETFVYAATIGPLPPDTEVTYRVGSPVRGMSAPRTASTPPGLDQSLRFVAYGDIGLDATAADGGRMPTRPDHPAHAVRDLTIAQKPDLLLLAGDLPYNNARDGWDTFMRFSDPLQSRVPTMPVIGNHEWATEAGLGYGQFLNTYVLPGDEHSYAYRAGPVTFIAVNTDTICSQHARGRTGTPPRPCDEQDNERINTTLVQWVERALIAATQDATPWTVVYHHHPAYSWGDHGSDWAVQTLLGTLYEEYDVDFVVTAHDHMYTRTYPVLNNRAVANGFEYAKGTAPVYVVAGGGGRSLYDLRAGPWEEWVAHAEKIHHLAMVDVTPRQLEFFALRADGSEMDRFRIVADDTAPDEPAPAPAWGATTAFLAIVLLLAARHRKTRCS